MFGRVLAAGLAALTLAGCVSDAPQAAEPASSVAEPPAPATLAATVSSVTLSDVPLGVPVALRLPDGGYYALRNDSHARLRVRLEPMKPTFCQRLPGQPVYAPIGDVAWVTVEPRELDLPPRSEAEAMVTVRLPEDPALLGRHLEFWIRAEAIASGMVSVALYSRVRLDVAREQPETLERVRARGPRARAIGEPR